MFASTPSRKSLKLSLIAAVLLAPVISQAAPVTTSPGKNSVFAREGAVLDATGDFPDLTGQIEKGKKKTVLKVEATALIQGNAAVAGAYLAMTVNGLTTAMASGQCDPASTHFCSLTGTYWLDLDAAELIIPGAFIGQPLNITLTGGNSAVAGAGLQSLASFSAQVVKK